MVCANGQHLSEEADRMHAELRRESQVDAHGRARGAGCEREGHTHTYHSESPKEGREGRRQRPARAAHSRTEH